jgi:undecaprenyl-diphosphatase
MTDRDEEPTRRPTDARDTSAPGVDAADPEAPDAGPHAADAEAPDTEAEAAGHDETSAAVDDLHPVQREARARRLGRRVPLIAGIVAVIMAALLGLVIMARFDGLPFEFDEEWAEELFEARGPVGDIFAFFMNDLGGGVFGVFVVPVLTAVVLLLCRRPWGALYFIVASIASAAVVQLLKNLFGRARPEDILVHSDFGSFPSGHVANAATIAVAIGVIVPIVWVWIAGAAYTLLMAVSRTYLGAHWLSDTLGGLLVGAGAALLLWAVFATPLERERLAWIARVSKRNAERAQAHVTPPARPRDTAA